MYSKLGLIGARCGGQVFGGIVSDRSNCPMGPVLGFYDNLVAAPAAPHDPAHDTLVAKFGTAAWWGGQGNTLPATVCGASPWLALLWLRRAAGAGM